MNTASRVGRLGLAMLWYWGIFALPVRAASIESLVAQYLTAVDGSTAARLLEAIEQQAASVEAVEAALDAQTVARQYPQAKTGSQPGLPLTVDGEAYDYALRVPPSYNPARAYPLIVCLHGAGFSGESYLERWTPRLGEDYLLACPTIEDGGWWTRRAARLVLGMIATVERQYHVDPDRIILTGMSNGGIGTYRIGMLHAERFAALAPMAGMVPEPLFPLLANLRDLPVYIIHGAKDDVIPVEWSRKIAKRLTELGSPVIFREHQQVHPQAGGHFFPKDELPALMTWLGSQRRQAYPPKIACVRGADEPTLCYWARLDEATTAQPVANRPGRGPAVQLITLTAEVKDRHTIHATTEGVARYTLFLNNRLVDLAAPLTIVTNGTRQFEGRVRPEVGTLLREARRRPDLRFPVALTFTVPRP